MKIWTSEYTFNHPWEKVAEAMWKKYPNPMNPAVIGMDVIDRKVINGELRTHRLVSSRWNLPRWALAIVGSAKICYASERSIVDANARRMVLNTRNVTFVKFIAVDETLTYEQHPEDKTKTLLKQEAIVTVQGVPLHSYIESVLTNTMMHNASKGRQAIEWVIDKIDTEVTEIRNSAAKSKEEILLHTKKSIDEITNSAKKSMDDFSSVAKKSLDEFHNLTNTPNQEIPKL